MLAVAPAASLAQESATILRLDGHRLRLGADSFARYIIRGSDTALVGSERDELRSDGVRLTRYYTIVDSINGTEADTIVSRLEDLRPLEYRSYSADRATQLVFGATAVVGWTHPAGADSSAVNTPLPPLVYDGSIFDLIVRASDLRDSMQISLPSFLPGMNGVSTMAGRVSGNEIVDGHPCWLFKGTNGGVSVSFWIDKDTRALRREFVQFRRQLGLLLTSPLPPERIVTTTERSRLEIGPNSLRHPDFGFVVPRPGLDFVPDTADQARLTAALAGHADMVAWAFINHQQHAVIIIQVVKGFATSERTLRNFAVGVREAFPQDKGWRLLEDAVHWEAERGEYRFGALAGSGVYVRFRCLPSPPERRPSVLVCVQTYVRDPEGLNAVRDGFTTAGVAP